MGARLLGALLSLAACGGDPSSGSERETGTPSTEVPTEESTPPGDTGWECNGWYPCQDCGGAECGAEIGACVADGGCQPALGAWAGCVLECGRPTACAATFAASGALAEALLDCTVASCAEVCDL